jgi:hypothetical protein
MESSPALPGASHDPLPTVTCIAGRVSFLLILLEALPEGLKTTGGIYLSNVILTESFPVQTQFM